MQLINTHPMNSTRNNLHYHDKMWKMNSMLKLTCEGDHHVVEDNSHAIVEQGLPKHIIVEVRVHSNLKNMFIHCKKKVNDFLIPSRDVTNQHSLAGKI
jgi:hypothetical protein